MSSPQKQWHSRLSLCVCPYFSGHFMMIYLNISLPLDCGLLRGRQPVWLTIYFYLLALSLAHDGPALRELLPAVSHSSSPSLPSWMYSGQHFSKLELVKLINGLYIFKIQGSQSQLHRQSVTQQMASPFLFFFPFFKILLKYSWFTVLCCFFLFKCFFF